MFNMVYLNNSVFILFNSILSIAELFVSATKGGIPPPITRNFTYCVAVSDV